MAAAYCIFHNHQQIKIRRAFQRMRANAADRYFRAFAGTEIRYKDYLTGLSKILFNTNLNTQNASHNLEKAMTQVLEQALTYLQESIAPE